MPVGVCDGGVVLYQLVQGGDRAIAVSGSSRGSYIERIRIVTQKTKTIFLLAGLAMGASASSQVLAPTTETAASTVPSGSVGGMAALAKIADRIDAYAAEFYLSPAELASTLRNDRSIYITPDFRMLSVCPLAPEQGDNGDGEGDGPGIAADPDIPLDDFLNLESNPGASKTIYLDFTGHHSVNDGWGHDITFPAYDTAGGTGTFTDAEKSDIINHWREVVEDMAPYNVNVTTKDPGTAALIKSNSGDQNYGVRCVMTQATSGFGNGIGGVAFLNSFNNNVDTPCFVFNKGLGAGPMSASHEVGHTFGLQHDGLNGQSYHPGSSGGNPSWGPIMGAPFGHQLVQWSNGDYPGSTSTQNDTFIITNSANGIGTYADDHSDSFLSGTVFDIANQATGMINSRTDIDALTFTVPTGDVNISVKNVDNGPNVDLTYELYLNSPLTLIDDFDPLGTSDAVQTYALTAGTYTIVIDGTFQTKTNGPVSDYGSFGRYTVDVSVILPPEPVVITFPNGIPTEFSDTNSTDILVNIDPGTFTLDNSNLTMLYSVGLPFPLTPVALVPSGGNNYTATIPAGACDDEVVFNFIIGLLDGPEVYSPENPIEFYSGSVVCESGECIADTNGDGILSPADFSAWVAAFNAMAPACDQNADGVCSPADFSAWVANYNAGCP